MILIASPPQLWLHEHCLSCVLFLQNSARSADNSTHRPVSAQCATKQTPHHHPVFPEACMYSRNHSGMFRLNSTTLGEFMHKNLKPLLANSTGLTFTPLTQTAYAAKCTFIKTFRKCALYWRKLQLKSCTIQFESDT